LSISGGIDAGVLIDSVAYPYQDFRTSGVVDYLIKGLGSGSIMFGSDSYLYRNKNTNYNIFQIDYNAGNPYVYMADRMGIGTLPGSTKLHIQGVDSTSSNYSLKIQDSATTSLFNVRNDGNVGIQTSNPTAKLHISDDASAVRDLFLIYDSFNSHEFLKVHTIGSSAGCTIDSLFAYWGLGCTGELSSVRLNVKGIGSTSSTWSFAVRNSSDAYSLVVADNKFVSINASNPAVYLDVNGDFATRSAASATAITANTNDLATAGRSFVRLDNTSGSAKDLTGFADGVDGKRLVIANVGVDNIHIKHQDTNSVAANRIITGSSGTQNVLTPDDTIELIYDAVTARWRIIHGA